MASPVAAAAVAERLQSALQQLTEVVAVGNGGGGGGGSLCPHVPGGGPDSSREDLLRRVASFRTGRWFAPPRELSPLECARHGWELVATQTLGCPLCEARVVFNRQVSPWLQYLSARGCQGADQLSLSAQGIATAGTAIEPQTAEGKRLVVAAAVAAVRSGHRGSCLWRDQPCPAELCKPSCGDLSPLRLRLGSLRCFHDEELPDVLPPRAPPPLSADILERLVCRLVDGERQRQPGDATRAVLALFGWGKRPGTPRDVLRCELCARQAGALHSGYSGQVFFRIVDVACLSWLVRRAVAVPTQECRHVATSQATQTKQLYCTPTEGRGRGREVLVRSARRTPPFLSVPNNGRSS
jgi:hypothetical protein